MIAMGLLIVHIILVLKTIDAVNALAGAPQAMSAPA
jgi:hypothetical protein